MDKMAVYVSQQYDELVLRLRQYNTFKTCPNQRWSCLKSQPFTDQDDTDVKPCYKRNRRTLRDATIPSKSVTSNIASVSRKSCTHRDDGHRDDFDKRLSEDTSRFNSKSEKSVTLNKTVGLGCRHVRGTRRTADDKQTSCGVRTSSVVCSLLVLVFDGASLSCTGRNASNRCWLLKVLFVFLLTQFACNVRGSCVNNSVVCLNTTACNSVGFSVCPQNVRKLCSLSLMIDWCLRHVNAR